MPGTGGSLVPIALSAIDVTMLAMNNWVCTGERYRVRGCGHAESFRATNERLHVVLWLGLGSGVVATGGVVPPPHFGDQMPQEDG